MTDAPISAEPAGTLMDAVRKALESGSRPEDLVVFRSPGSGVTNYLGIPVRESVHMEAGKALLVDERRLRESLKSLLDALPPMTSRLEGFADGLDEAVASFDRLTGALESLRSASDALTKARRLWGPSGFATDHAGRLSDRYAVGRGGETLGFGDTWEAAFKDAEGKP